MNVADYFLENINHIGSRVSKKNIRVVLVGLGPHAKRIYLNYLKKHHIQLELVIEVSSSYNDTKAYLKEHGFSNTKIFTIEDKYKNNIHLPELIQENLKAVCKTLEITHMLIATEPKAHYMYLEFALKNNIHVLSDKPITVVKNMLRKKNIEKVNQEYYDLLALAEQSHADCKIMCQRQYHRGYEYIKKILADVVKKYQIPITYIDIYHCDGNFEMPHDLFKENHPYKYGYGKLFHSGYHFIDLLSEFLKINDILPEEKRIRYGEVYSNSFTPKDELNVFTIDDYKRIFKGQEIPDFYRDTTHLNLNNMGEKNYYGLFKFTNQNHQLITTANLHLLHYGFSRRGWIQSRDYYKSNGRIRHERINIQVGPLLNIQVHSYQSKEIKDRTLEEEMVGGLEHFDIDIYRNTDIIGGKPFERIRLGDLYTEKEKKDFLGYNELAREEFLNHFFKGDCKRGDIKDQKLSVEILTGCAKGLYDCHQEREKVEKIKMGGIQKIDTSLEKLKKVVTNQNLQEKKKLIRYKKFYNHSVTCGVALHYLIDKKMYECYMYLSTPEQIVGNLCYKMDTSKLKIFCLYHYLCFLLKHISIEKIVYKLMKLYKI